MLENMTLKERLKHILIFLSSNFIVWLLGREIFLKLLRKHNITMEYRVKKHFDIAPIETFLTRFFPGTTTEQEVSLVLRKWYKIDGTVDFLLKKDYMNIYKEIPGLKNLISVIVEEHYYITKKTDQNLNYLWYLYYKAGKAGEYRPFILIAEIQLLNKLGYLSDDEVKNIVVMMESKDLDNLNLVYLSVLALRNKRVEKHGIYNKTEVSDELTKLVKDYSYTVLNTEILTKFWSNY